MEESSNGGKCPQHDGHIGRKAVGGGGALIMSIIRSKKIGSRAGEGTAHAVTRLISCRIQEVLRPQLSRLGVLAHNLFTAARVAELLRDVHTAHPGQVRDQCMPLREDNKICS